MKIKTENERQQVQDYNDLFTKPNDKEVEDLLNSLDGASIAEDMMVPLYHKKEGNYLFIGNGVLVDKYLITAAHVAQTIDKKTNYFVLYYRIDLCSQIKEDCSFDIIPHFIEVNDTMVLFDGRIMPDVKDVCNDLIVYKLDVSNDYFKYNLDPIKEGTVLNTMPYSIAGKKDDVDVIERIAMNCNVLSTEADVKCDNETMHWENCFMVDCSSQLTGGNSGCAVYKNKVLYGIYLGTMGNQFVVLKASYIAQCIEECENRDVGFSVRLARVAEN